MHLGRVTVGDSDSFFANHLVFLTQKEIDSGIFKNEAIIHFLKSICHYYHGRVGFFKDHNLALEDTGLKDMIQQESVYTITL